MLGEMSSLMKGTRTLNAVISADQLKAMYGNTTGANFAGTFSKNLKSKTFAADSSFFLTWMEKMSTDSELAQEAAQDKQDSSAKPTAAAALPTAAAQAIWWMPTALSTIKSSKKASWVRFSFTKPWRFTFLLIAWEK